MAENIRLILAWSVPALVSLDRSQGVRVNRQHKSGQPSRHKEVIELGRRGKQSPEAL